MDPDEKAKIAVNAILQTFSVGRPMVDVESFFRLLREKGYYVAKITQWGKDPAGRW